MAKEPKSTKTQDEESGLDQRTFLKGAAAAGAAAAKDIPLLRNF